MLSVHVMLNAPTDARFTLGTTVSGCVQKFEL